MVLVDSELWADLESKLQGQGKSFESLFRNGAELLALLPGLGYKTLDRGRLKTIIERETQATNDLWQRFEKALGEDMFACSKFNLVVEEMKLEPPQKERLLKLIKLKLRVQEELWGKMLKELADNHTTFEAMRGKVEWDAVLQDFGFLDEEVSQLLSMIATKDSPNSGVAPVAPVEAAATPKAAAPPNLEAAANALGADAVEAVGTPLSAPLEAAAIPAPLSAAMPLDAPLEAAAIPLDVPLSAAIALDAPLEIPSDAPLSAAISLHAPLEAAATPALKADAVDTPLDAPLAATPLNAAIPLDVPLEDGAIPSNAPLGDAATPPNAAPDAAPHLDDAPHLNAATPPNAALEAAATPLEAPLKSGLEDVGAPVVIHAPVTRSEALLPSPPPYEASGGLQDSSLRSVRALFEFLGADSSEERKVTVKSPLISEMLRSQGNNSAFSVLQNEFERRFATAEDFDSLAREIKKDPQGKKTDFSRKHLLTFYALCRKSLSIDVFLQATNDPQKPLPFLVLDPMCEPPIWKLLLPSLEGVFASTSVCVVSLGTQAIGKTTFLNLILSKEEENSGPAFFTKNTFKRLAERGVEVIPKINVYDQGTLTPSLNVFDFQLDLQRDRVVIERTLSIFPVQTVVLMHLNPNDEFFEQQYSDACAITRSFPNVIFVLRDSSEVPATIRAEQKNCFALESLDESPLPDLMPIRDRVFELARELARARQGTVGIEWAFSHNSPELSDTLARDYHRIQEARELLASVSLPSEVLKLNAIAKRIYEIDQSISRLDKESRDSTVRGDRLAQIERLAAERAEKTAARTQPRHLLVCIFEEIFCSGDKRLIRAFETETQLWTSRQTANYMREYKRLKNELRQEAKGADDATKQEQRKRVEELGLRIDSMSMSQALFLREISAFYTHEATRSQAPAADATTFFKKMAEFVQKGGSLEIIDGAVSKLAESQLRKVLNAYQELQGHGNRPIVISVIGPQSSGKSTLLNFLFRSSFEASAGRCTQGMFCSLMKTDISDADLALILDTEGLLSIEKNNPIFDKQITTLAMAVSDVLIVNIKGEVNQSMKDILSVSLLSAQELDKAKKKSPVIYFVLRDMASTDISKHQEAISSITATLDDLSRDLGLPSLKDSQILQYREENSFILVHDAFHTYAHLTTQPNSALKVPLFSTQNVSSFFRNETVSLLGEIFRTSNLPRNSDHEAFDLRRFVDDVSATWQSITFSDNLTGLDDLKEKRARIRLQEVVQKIEETIREPLRGKIDEVERKADDYERDAADVSELERKVRDIELLYQGMVKVDFDSKVDASDYEKLKSEYRQILTDFVTSKLEPTRTRLKLIQAYGPWATMMREKSQKLLENVNKSIKEMITGSNISVEMIPEKVAALETEVKNVVTELDKNLSDLRSQIPYLQRSFDLVTAVVKFQSFASATSFVLNITHVEKGSELISRFERNETGDKINRALYQRTLLGKHFTGSERGNIELRPPNGLDESDFTQYLSRAIIVSHSAFAHEFDRAKQQRSTDSTLTQIVTYFTSKLRGESAEAKVLDEEALSKQILRLQLTSGSLVLQEFCQVVNEHVPMELSEQQLEQAITKVQNGLKDIGGHLNHQICTVERNCFLTSLAVVLLKSVENHLQAQDKRKMTAFVNDMKNEGTGMVNQFSAKLTAACGGAAMADAVAQQMRTKMTQFYQKSIKFELEHHCRLGFETTPQELASRANAIVSQSDAKSSDITSFAKTLNLYQASIYQNMFQESLTTQRTNVGGSAKRKYDANVTIIVNRLKRLLEKCAIQPVDKEATNQLFIAWLCKPSELKAPFADEDQSYVPPYTEDQLLASKFFETDIPDLCAFLQLLVPKFSEVESPNLLEHAKQIDLDDASLNSVAKTQSLGCAECCPYCGAKCDRAGPHPLHAVDKHRVMGLRGSFSQDPKGPQLLPYVCGEPFILNESKWNPLENPGGLDTAPRNREAIDVRKRELLTSRGAKPGALEFVLEWKDPNDLDLFVTCTCKAKLGLGSECPTCKGKSDLDMNFRRVHHATEPQEHCVFPTGNLGTYKLEVRNFCAEKTFERKTGGKTSCYNIQVWAGGAKVQDFGSFQKPIAADGTFHTYVYEHVAEGISFTEHRQRFYPNWVGPNLQQTHDEFVVASKKFLHDNHSILLTAFGLTE